MMSGEQTNVNYYISAVDAPSFLDLLKSGKAVIHEIVETSIRKNQVTRKTIKRFT